MFHQFLQSLKLRSSGDVITAIVKLSDFVVFHVVALHLVPVSYR